jgi:hypothetical protein
MRDSINYNLKYFIMKMSGTKPMKNTMRKPSPLKFAELSTPEGKAASKVGATVGKKAGTRNTSAIDAAKPAEGKPKLTKDNTVKVGGMLRVSKEKAAEVSAKKATTTTKPVEGKPSSKPTTQGGLKGALEKAKAKAQANKPVEGKPSSKPAAQGGLRGALEKAKAKAQANKSETTKTGTAAPKKTGNLRDLKNTLKARSEAKKAAATKPVEGKPSAKPATKSVTKEMIGGGGVPQLRKHKR